MVSKRRIETARNTLGDLLLVAQEDGVEDEVVGAIEYVIEVLDAILDGEL